AEKFNNAAAGHFTRAAEYEKQAFVAATDAEKQEAYTNAYRAQLAGQAAQKQAQDAQILADRLAEQAAAVRNEIALWDKVARQVGDLTARVDQEGKTADSEVRTASSEKGLAITNMREAFDAITEAYRQGVAARLSESVNLSRQAVDLIDAAQGSADRTRRTDIAFDRLGARVTLTQGLTRQSRYARDFASILNSIAQNPAVSGTSAAQSARAAASKFADEATSFAEQAQAVIDDGLQEVEEQQLAGESATGRAASTMAQALRTYAAQLN
ncbi:MAG: hypothetical protein AAGL98_03405, partial [Planctomycetota bacterium]